VRYADGSVVHFEDFYTNCNTSNACSVNPANDSAAGATLNADSVNAGAVADDGLLVYAHGSSDVLMSMAEDQAGLSAALASVDSGATLTYSTPSPLVGLGALAMFGLGVAAIASSNKSSDAPSNTPEPTNAGQTRALNKIATAARDNIASTSVTFADYQAAGVTGVSEGSMGNLAAINSALDSGSIGLDQANSAAKLQAVVDAYRSILTAADGTANTPTPTLTAAQYTAIGVTGLGAATTAPAAGTALFLLDSAVDKAANSTAASQPKVQDMANAALDVMAAVGQGLSTTVSKADLDALGIAGVTDANVAAVQAALSTTNAANTDTLSKLQTLVNTAILPANLDSALGALKTAAEGNTAASLTALDYAKAGLSGVNAGNVAAINSALNSLPVGGAQLATQLLAQGIVDAYNAILANADGLPGNPTSVLNADQYLAVGVTGLTPGATAGPGSALALLGSTVDASGPTAVDTAVKLQTLADAAAHVMTAAGLPAGTANPLTGADLAALGVTGLNANNTQAVINAIVASTPDSLVDTLAKLQAVATLAETKALTALNSIIAAAHADTSNDLIYLRGKWSDYNKSTDIASNTITFTRTANPTEVVKVTGGTPNVHDTVVFADGAVQSNDAFTTINTIPLATTSQIKGAGFAASPTTPLISDAVIAASIDTLKAAAHADNATLPTALTETAYKNANAKNVVTANVAAYNSALDSAAIDTAQVASTAEVQKIVDAFNAIVASADGNATPNTSTPLTAAQFVAVGVTGAPTSVNGLALLDNVVDVSAAVAVDTTAELKLMAKAATDVAAVVGQGMSTTVTQGDLAAMGITGTITPENIAAIQAAIGLATPGSLNTKAALQTLVDAAILPANLDAALAVLKAAATNDSAATLTAVDYAKAGLTGVTVGNVAALNSALNSTAVSGAQLATEPLAQGIVDAYNAILAAADGTANIATPTLTAAQYAAIGVTGLGEATTAPAIGTALFLLDSAVDKAQNSTAASEPLVQGMADAAKDVMAAVGQALSTTVAKEDLEALGITGVTPANIAAVQAALVTATAVGVDTLGELQTLVNDAIVPANLDAALAALKAAALNNAAANLTPVDYAKAGLTGVTAGNVAALNSALNSVAVSDAQVATKPLAQGVVDAYNAILAAADGSANTPTPTLTAAQYAAIGVTGLGAATTAPAAGTALFLLDSAVDKAQNSTAASEPLVQDMANAALDVMTAVGQGLSTTVSKADLDALGITGVTAANIAAVQAALGAATAANADTLGKLQALVENATSPAALDAALTVLKNAATNDTAANLTAVDYAKAGLTDVTVANVATINSALTTTNTAYDDILAIWDSVNTGTSTQSAGIPTGWYGSVYWTATPSTSGHSFVDLPGGAALEANDFNGLYVAFKVL